jgi:KaiC/GvpD/RAD55 family RecA-like ATPase
MKLLTDEEINTRATGVSFKTYQYIKPLAAAVDGLIEGLANPEGRLMWGIRDLDVMMRGIADGEVCYVTGRSHSGKTQLVLQAMCNSPHKRWLYFTPDEVTELVLLKLAGIMRGVGAEDVEKALVNDDEQMVSMLRDVAAKDFPNTFVLDDPFDLDSVEAAIHEAEGFWGEPVQGVVLDYLEVFDGEGDHDGVTSKNQHVKRMVKRLRRPYIVIHQGKRGDRGSSKGIDGMRYGGENEANYVVEVYRKIDDTTLDAAEREAEANTVTVGVVKNKRPPCKKGHVDLFIHPAWGAIRPLAEGDRRVGETWEDKNTAAWEKWKAQRELMERQQRLET